MPCGDTKQCRWNAVGGRVDSVVGPRAAERQWAPFAEVEPGKLVDLEAARKQVSELEAPPPLRFLADGAADVVARWEAAPRVSAAAGGSRTGAGYGGQGTEPGHRRRGRAADQYRAGLHMSVEELSRLPGLHAGQPRLMLLALSRSSPEEDGLCGASDQPGSSPRIRRCSASSPGLASGPFGGRSTRCWYQPL